MTVFGIKSPTGFVSNCRKCKASFWTEKKQAKCVACGNPVESKKVRGKNYEN